MNSNECDIDLVDDDYEIVEPAREPETSSNFDEVDEFMDEIMNEKKEHDKSYDSSLFEEEAERASPVLVYKTNETCAKSESSGKSKFYFNSVPNLPSLDEPDLQILPRENFDEKFLGDIKNVMCSYSENTCLNNSYPHRELKNTSVNVDGRLVLTSLRLIFVPSANQTYYDPTKIFYVDKRLKLFNHKNPNIISIPIVSIHEIRARKLKLCQTFCYRKFSIHSNLQNMLRKIFYLKKLKNVCLESDGFNIFCLFFSIL
jgi:hypothetical protein